jgi:hypothetical protein
LFVLEVEDDDVELEDDVEFEPVVEVEPGFVLRLFAGVEGEAPQPTRVAAIAVIRVTRQVFTPNSPAVIWK